MYLVISYRANWEEPHYSKSCYMGSDKNESSFYMKACSNLSQVEDFIYSQCAEDPHADYIHIVVRGQLGDCEAINSGWYDNPQPGAHSIQVVNSDSINENSENFSELYQAAEQENERIQSVLIENVSMRLNALKSQREKDAEAEKRAKEAKAIADQKAEDLRKLEYLKKKLNIT